MRRDVLVGKGTMHRALNWFAIYAWLLLRKIINALQNANIWCHPALQRLTLNHAHFVVSLYVRAANRAAKNALLLGGVLMQRRKYVFRLAPMVM